MNSTAELNQLYLDALERGSSKILLGAEDEIAADLAEVFGAGDASPLGEASLAALFEAGLVDDELRALSREFREQGRTLLDARRDQNLELIATDAEWTALFRLADKILRLKKTRDASKN